MTCLNMTPILKLTAATVAVGLVLLLIFSNQYSRSSEYSRVMETITLNRVPINSNLLIEYAGRYQLKVGFEVSVTQEDGRIFAQATDQQRVEFYPASETVFFNEITPLLMKFERDDNGAVEHFLALEPGRNRVASRITGQ